MIWTCVGFDLRIAGPDLSDAVFKSRLLVERRIVLSGDPVVWRPTKSVSDYLCNLNQRTVVNPLELANNSEALLRVFRESRTDDEAGTLVAFAVDPLVLKVLTVKWGPGCFDAPQRVELKEDWIFAGYDVLELPGLTSGLSGCGYDPVERDILLEDFATAINAYGLFDALEAATRFAMLRGLQLREHAPFVPVRILTKPVPR